MHLLNTTTYKLHDFIDADSAPKYAILSHRWGSDEISYKDYSKGRYNRKSSGYRKIIDCCNYARHRGREWAWIDTCCIDKRSSAELSEAINSMYYYYQQARECYVHLADVAANCGDRETVLAEVRESSWFTRGWTLQELIAPKYLIFVNVNWEDIGFKTSKAPPKNLLPRLELQDLICSVTGIPRHMLDPSSRTGNEPFSERMCWAANRQTTRVEDSAYCLLGLFGLQMFLLYGERNQAFVRLQREVFARTRDETMLAWSGRPAETEPILLEQGTPIGSMEYRGTLHMLATSPACFPTSDQALQMARLPSSPITLTDRGVEVQVERGSGSRVSCCRVLEVAAHLLRLQLACTIVASAAPVYGREAPRPAADVYIYLIETGCGHYVRCDLIGAWRASWEPFQAASSILIHHSQQDAYASCGPDGRALLGGSQST